MNCVEFQSRLDQLVELRSDPDLDLRQHGEECGNSECRNAWADFELLHEAIPSWLADVRQADMVRSVGVTSSIQGHRLRARSMVTLLSLTVVAVAAFQVIRIPRSEETGLAVGPGFSMPRDVAVRGRAESTRQLRSLDAGKATSSADAVEQRGLSIDWIAETPLQVSSSVAYMLLGNSEPAVEAPRRTNWLEGWQEQIIPSREDFELIRTLLVPGQENQTSNPGFPAELSVS
ncbi:hypothetical protein SH661x_001140 [Planctomicrobium sp. SH661]|uniref:hypothetical protein n=1 Tax=Planctomicrobium sp. SH661 TaxID=3448124 RepID=UPI003F5AF849